MKEGTTLSDRRPVTLLGLGFLTWLAFHPTLQRTVNAQTVAVWETNIVGSKKLQRQQDLAFSSDNPGEVLIEIDPSKAYQTLDGFGYTLTQGSAEAISRLSAAKQTQLLNELFPADPITIQDGLAVSVLRIGIGATDLSRSVYGYNDHAGDVEMSHFDMSGPDKEFLLPLLKRIVALNPKTKLIATPWSAPPWMKTNQAWVGGHLSPKFYRAYANYFVAYLRQMDRLGLPIWAVTPQNEPENGHNEPSLVMTAEEQLAFVDKHLGPAIKDAGLQTKIIVFDHNCDHPEYPIKVLNGSRFADGAAFHLYAGDISAMSHVHEATGKDVYFTEQWTSSDGDFGGDLRWHMKNVVIGSLNNWSKCVLEWNLASDASFGPHTPGGCQKCLGAVTVLDEDDYRRNVAYYTIGHVSRFVRPGATRIASHSRDPSLLATALQNRDGTILVVLLNDSDSVKTFSLSTGSKSIRASMDGGSVASLVWNRD